MSATPAKGAARTRVLLVDDHPIVRRGLAQLINQEADMRVCGEAVDEAGGLRQVEGLGPDIVIVDLSLKDGDGLTLIKAIRRRWRDLPVLVLSMHDENVYAERALRAGAQGYIMKHEALENVLQAVRAILRGERYVSPQMHARLVASMAGYRPRGVARLAELADRELEIFQMIGRGFGTREIARRLRVSVKTVESYCARIKEKLGLKNATELLQSATLWMASGEK